MEIDLVWRPIGHPDAIRLADAMSAEVSARQAHADDMAVEQLKSLAEAVGPDGEVLVAYAGDDAVAIGALRQLEPEVGEIKRMYVAPAQRGTGVARLLFDVLERRARERGFGVVRLDTHDSLAEANRLYTGAGYREIADYNGNPSANRWFEKLLA
jgi:GNAT superfamily N-acetyltransferase